jgi:hypothetical protein
LFDEAANLGSSQDIPYASQCQFEDDQGGDDPVSNAVPARTEDGTGEVSHGVDLRVATSAASFLNIIIILTKRENTVDDHEQSKGIGPA